MQFISIKELATADVDTLSSDTILSSAIVYMFQRDHRNIVITHESQYLVLSVHDILSFHQSDRSTQLPLSELALNVLPSINKNTDILEALSSLDYSIEHFIATNDDGSLYGLVAHSDIISSIDPDTLMESYRIQDFVKAHENYDWVSKDEITRNVFGRLQDNNNNAVVIIEDKKPIGIITTKDVLRLLQDTCDLSQPIAEYMVTPISTLGYHCTVKEALEYIKDKHFKQIVTVDDKGEFFAAITQKNLIAVSYSRWISVMKDYQSELNSINKILEQKSNKYEKLASIDSLTGLYNRMKFMKLYVSEYTIMVQRDNDMVLMMIDLDHFKTINDTFGHSIGDQVLVEVSKLFLSQFRSNDIICRWGGEEFIVLMPSTTLQDASILAERMRVVVEDISENSLPELTASFGLTQIIHGDTLTSALNRADQAMYNAKNSGRNCVQVQ